MTEIEGLLRPARSQHAESNDRYRTPLAGHDSKEFHTPAVLSNERVIQTTHVGFPGGCFLRIFAV
jgi:hypothetical protein